MGLLFKDDLLDEFGSWPIAYIPYGGADFGEIEAVAKAVGGGDAVRFHEAWVAAGDRFAAEAEAAERRGSLVSARELFLRASVFYSTSLHPLFGAPVDPRLLAAYRKEIDALDRGLRLFDPPILPQRIPFEGAAMPGFFGVRRRDMPLQRGRRSSSPTATTARSPTCCLLPCWPPARAAITASCSTAPAREGCCSSTGSAQAGLGDGRERGRRLRAQPASSQFEEDRFERLEPWRLSCAPRGLRRTAARGLHRRPGTVGDRHFVSSSRDDDGFAGSRGGRSRDARRCAPTKFGAMIAVNKSLKWRVVQRGFWANGQTNLRDYLREIERFTLDGRVEAIRCPTLLTAAENDPLAKGAQRLHDALKCRKRIVLLSWPPKARAVTAK